MNVVGVIGSTTNMPSGTAVKPGDVVQASNGKYIEIINTDAEGRLVLADVLAYARDVKGHPANQDVMLRLMPASGGPSQPLAKLFGGQGTINVPSWSPDGRQIAFVSYRLVR